MFHQHRYERTDPPGVQQPVLLLDNILDVFPGNPRKPGSQTVHDFGQRPQFFTYTHRKSVGSPASPVKT